MTINRFFRARLVPLLVLVVLGASASISLHLTRSQQAIPPSCQGEPATILGTSAGETLNGTSGPDVILARGGADEIRARGGDDLVCAGRGADVVKAGAGNDSAVGGRGTDDLRGGTGSDNLVGGAGEDTANGGEGDDDCVAETEISCEDLEPSPSPTTSPTTSPSPSPSDSPSPSPSPSTPGGGGGGPSNQAPVVDASAGNTGYTENAAGVVIDNALTVSDTDDTNLESATVSITGNFQNGDNLGFTDTGTIDGTYTSGTGVLSLVGTDTIANYQAALRTIEFSSTQDDPSATKTVSFVANDGSTNSAADTKTIAISIVDDLPTAVDDSATVTEDAVAAAVTVLSNDTDLEADPITISSATDPANGTVVLTGGSPGQHTGLTYQPDPNYCNAPPGTSPDTFTYTVNGGSTATVSMTVNCVDDLGTANDDSASVNEDSGANTIDVLGNDSDGGDGGSVITSTSDPANGTVAITNSGADLTYTPDSNYCNNPPGTSPDTFTYTITGGSTATVSVTVDCVDDAPVAVDDSATVNEDSGATAVDVLANDTDVDGGSKTISSATDPANGTVVLTGGSPGAHTGLTYQPDPNYCNAPPGTSPDTFTYTVNGGDSATVSVTVDCVGEAPIVTTTAAALAYTENDAATSVDAGLTVTDPENDNIGGASASISANFQSGQDFLEWQDNDLNDNVILNGALTSSQTIVLMGVDTTANYQAALRAVTYRNGSENPSTVNRTVTFSATDSPGGLTGSNTRTISITAVDDPPDAVDDSATVLEDASATSIPVLTNDTDIDGGPKNIASATDPANGTVVLTGGSPGAHTGLTYQPDPNYCNDPPGTTPDTFQYTVNGGDTAFVSMTVTCVNDAPVADDETFNGNDSAHGNTTMQVDDPDDDKSAPTNPHTEITGDILAGDTDVDGPGPLTVTQGTFATNDGGSVTLESDGDFVFQPATSTSCTDTSDFFDYTVEDSGSPEQTDTGRVTISIAGCVWYVSNNAAGNSGTSTAPFDTLAQAETASGTNHTVFVFDGDNTSAGLDAAGYFMNSGERLIGEHEGLVVDPDGGGGLTADTLHPANAGAHPTLVATGADVIDLDDGNEVRGFILDPAGAGGGIAGSSGDTGGGTIDDVNIIDTGTAGQQPSFELDSTTGTFNISNLVVNNTAATSPPNTATGVRLNNAGTVNFNPTGQISITTQVAKGLEAITTNMGSGSTFDDITVSSSTAGGVVLSSASGTTILGDGTGVDLSLTTASGATPTLFVQNSGTVSVGAAGTDELHATGAPALDVTGTSGPTFEFDDVDSTNSANDGINLDGLGTGTFTATSGDLAGAAGISFDLNGGSGAITYPGNLSNGGGTTAIDITGRSGGVVSLSGVIADTNDAGGGLSMGSNTGGSTVLSNGTKQFNTGASDAVLFNNSDGHTLTLSGGGLDIDTTSGKGLEASTSGTIEVSGSGNTVDTGTGRPLNVANTDIAAADMSFRSISTNGAINGIVLNNTGSAGNLVVAGDGDGNPDGGGGVIQATTGHGIALTSTASPSLTDITVSGAGDGDNEYGMHLTNVSGTVALDDVTFNGAADNLVQLDNANTNATFTVTGSVFSYPGVIGPNANSAMLLQPNGTSALTASVTGTTFTDIKSASLQIGAATAGSNGTSSLTFTGNTINSAAGRAGGVVISPQETTTTSVTIQNNTFTGAGGNGVISIDANDTSTVTGTISNNGITNAPGVGIFSAVDEGATSTLTFNNNTITNSGGDGFQLVNFGGIGTSTMNATVTNNVVNGHSLDTNVNFLGGMSFTSFEDVMDLQLTGNSVTNTPASPTQCGGAPCVDYFLQESAGTFRLEEIPDTAATTATAAYVNSTNDAGPVDIFGTIDLSNGVEISSS